MSVEHVLTDEELGQFVWDIIVGNEAGTITSIEPEEIGRLLRECIEYKAAFVLVPAMKLQSLEIHAQQGGALFEMLGGVVNLMRERMILP